MDRFGHFGYAAYFILIEIFDRHGTGDVLTISRKCLANKLRCKSKSLENILRMFQESGRVRLEHSGDILTIEIPKFRKRQSKLKSKVRSKFPQSSPNVPQEGEGEGEREKNKPPNPPMREKDVQQNLSVQKHEEFSEWWKSYPKKVGKAATLKIWLRVVRGKIPLPKMLETLSKQKKSEQWTKSGGQFIPHPATYLNQGRWDDEVETVKKSSWKKYDDNVCMDCKKVPPVDGVYCRKCRLARMGDLPDMAGLAGTGQKWPKKKKANRV